MRRSTGSPLQWHSRCKSGNSHSPFWRNVHVSTDPSVSAAGGSKPRVTRARSGKIGSDGGAEAGALDKRELLATLMAFKGGNFKSRLPADLHGIDGKIADTLNDLIELHARLAAELRRLVARSR